MWMIQVRCLFSFIKRNVFLAFFFFFFLLLTSNTLVLLGFSISGQTRSPLPIEGSCVAKISRKSIKGRSTIDDGDRFGHYIVFWHFSEWFAITFLTRDRDTITRYRSQLVTRVYIVFISTILLCFSLRSWLRLSAPKIHSRSIYAF